MQRPGRLFNRNFFLLWQGQLVSNLGNQAFAIAMIFWIKDTTDSASLIGLLLLMTGIPAVLLGPIGGTIADRHSRRNIILLSDLASGLAVVALAGLMFFLPDATNLILVCIFVVAVFIATLNPFFTPAIAAAIPDLVPEKQVARANSFSQAGLELIGLVGQGLAGVLYRFLGAPILFLVNGLTYLFSAASEAFITIPQTIPEQKSRWQDRLAEFKYDLVKGLRYIWYVRGLRGLILLSTLVNFFSVPIVVLLPFYVDDFLRLTPDWYGFLLASYSAGTLMGYILVGVFVVSGRMRARLMLGGMALEATCYILIVLIGAPLSALGLAIVAGLANGFLLVNMATIMQISTPGELRGRVFGLLGTIAASITPIAAGLSGIVADLVDQNIPLIYLVCSAMMLLLTVTMALNRDIRGFLACEEVAVIGAEPQAAGTPPGPTTAEGSPALMIDGAAQGRTARHLYAGRRRPHRRSISQRHARRSLSHQPETRFGRS